MVFVCDTVCSMWTAVSISNVVLEVGGDFAKLCWSSKCL